MLQYRKYTEIITPTIFWITLTAVFFDFGEVRITPVSRPIKNPARVPTRAMSIVYPTPERRNCQ